MLSRTLSGLRTVIHRRYCPSFVSRRLSMFIVLVVYSASPVADVRAAIA